MIEFVAVPKRETLPRRVYGIDFLNRKILIDISGCYEWHEYKKLRRNIGKEDVEGESIYADSSIVEFDYAVTLDKSQKLIGVFTWDSEALRYSLKIPKHFETLGTMWYDYGLISNLKVIGTVEGNKELLEEKKGKDE